MTLEVSRNILYSHHPKIETNTWITTKIEFRPANVLDCWLQQISSICWIEKKIIIYYCFYTCFPQERSSLDCHQAIIYYIFKRGWWRMQTPIPIPRNLQKPFWTSVPHSYITTYKYLNNIYVLRTSTTFQNIAKNLIGKLAVNLVYLVEIYQTHQKLDSKRYWGLPRWESGNISHLL